MIDVYPFLLLIGLCLLTGYGLLAIIPLGADAERPGAIEAMGLGLAGLVVALSLLVLVVPVKWALGLVLALSMGSVLWKQLRSAEPLRIGFSWLLFLVCAFAIAWGHIRPEGTGLFEGTANHDSLYYVAGASRLLEHGLGALPDAAPPVYQMLDRFWGVTSALQRTGSFVLLGALGAAAGAPSEDVYVGCSLALLLMFALLAPSLAVRPDDRGLRGAIVYAVGVVAMLVCGIVWFTLLNSNFANLLALPLVVVALSGWLRCKRKPDLLGYLLIAMPMAALVVGYPELLVIAAGLLAVDAVASMAMREGSAASYARVLAIAAVASVVLVLPYMVGMALTAKTLEAVSTGGGDDNTFLLKAPWYHWLIAIERIWWLKEGFWNWLTLGWMSVGLGLALLGRARSLAVAALVVYASLVSFVVLRGYGYGEVKVVQYAGPFVHMVAVLGIVESLLPIRGRRWVQVLAVACGGALALSSYNAIRTLSAFSATYEASKVYDDTYRRLQGLLPADGAPVLIAETLSSKEDYRFFRAHWLAYALRDRVLVYPAKGEDGYLRGGYAHDQLMAREHMMGDVRYVVAPTAGLMADPLDQRGRKIGFSDEYVVLDVHTQGGAVILPIAGVGDARDGQRSIGRNAEFEVQVWTAPSSALAVTLCPGSSDVDVIIDGEARGLLHPGVAQDFPIKTGHSHVLLSPQNDGGAHLCRPTVGQQARR